MKKLNLLIAIFCLMISGLSLAQTSTEQFETESHGSSSFTDNGVIFNIISHNAPNSLFDIGNFPNTGWSGTSNDNKYIDNTGTGTQENANASFSIKTTSNLFKVNRFWVYLSNPLLNLNTTGTLTITGKLSGVTKFTQTKMSGFATTLGTTNGYTLIDLTNLNGQNYSNIIVDELRLTIGGDYRYFGLDAFTWVKDSGIVIDLDALTLTVGTQNNVSCNGGSNGSATVNVSGGTAPYTYSWSTSSSTGATATGLAAGIHTVTVKDAVNATKTQDFIITQPPVLTAGISKTDATCGESNGVASVNITGGTAPYTYLWSNGATTNSVSNLIAGSYNVTVTDAEGCFKVNNFMINDSVISAPAIKLSFSNGNTLSTFSVIGQGIKWYATEANAIAHTNPLPGSTPIVNNAIYYATQTVAGCESKTPLAINAYNETLNVSDVSKNSAITLYPNPVKEVLNLSSESKINKVIISDYSGRKVLDKTLSGENKVNVQALVKGNYLIQIFTEKGVESIKFIKD